jgi:hypothetical protein
MAKARRNIPRSPTFINGRPVVFGPMTPELLLQMLQRSQPAVRKLSGKEWVPAAYARRPDELIALGITGASGALATESKTAPDCAKPLTAGYIKNLLRENGAFPKANRGRK